MDSMIIEAEITNVPQAVAQAQALAKAIKKVPPKINVSAVGLGTTGSGKASLTQTTKDMINPRNRGRNVVPPTMAEAFGKQMKNVFMSSRFSADGGLMPLVGQTLKLFPPQLQLAAAALTLLTRSASDSAAAIADMRSAQYTSGGTQAQANQLGSLGGALGLSKMDMAQMSRNLSTALQAPGAASGFGARIGIYDNQGAFGDTNKAKNLARAIDYITSKQTTQMEAERVARELNIESVLRLRDLSQGLRDALADDAKLSTMLTSKQDIVNAGQYAAEVNRMQASWGQLWDVIGQGVTPYLIPAAQQLTRVGQAASIAVKALSKINDAFTGSAKVMKYVSDLMSGENPDAKDWFRRMTQVNQPIGAGATSGEKAATEAAHTDAMKGHTKALEDANQAYAKNGTYGGGTRAQGAIPKGFAPGNYDAWRAMVAGLGAFQL